MFEINQGLVIGQVLRKLTGFLKDFPLTAQGECIVCNLHEDQIRLLFPDIQFVSPSDLEGAKAGFEAMHRGAILSTREEIASLNRANVDATWNKLSTWRTDPAIPQEIPDEKVLSDVIQVHLPNMPSLEMFMWVVRELKVPLPWLDGEQKQAFNELFNTFNYACVEQELSLRLPEVLATVIQFIDHELEARKLAGIQAKGNALDYNISKATAKGILIGIAFALRALDIRLGKKRYPVISQLLGDDKLDEMLAHKQRIGREINFAGENVWEQLIKLFDLESIFEDPWAFGSDDLPGFPEEGDLLNEMGEAFRYMHENRITPDWMVALDPPNLGWLNDYAAHPESESIPDTSDNSDSSA